MARSLNCIDSELLVTIPVRPEWIMLYSAGKGKRTRYVFLDTFSSAIRQLSKSSFGDLKLYLRYIQSIRRRLYNTTEIYGLPAINIDEPQDAIASVRLKFIIDNSGTAKCAYRPIERKM